MQVAFIKSKYMTFMGLAIFLVVMSPLMIQLMTWLSFEPGIVVYEYIDNHQIGIILASLPFMLWGYIKDYRILGVITLICLLLLMIKTKIPGL